MPTLVGLFRSPSCAHRPRNAPRIGALTETWRRSGPDLRIGIAHGFATLGTYPELTCLEVDPFQVRAEASSLLAEAEEDFAVEGIRDCRRAAARGAAHTQEAAHMSYFVATEGLRERLLASGSARVINTASAAHQGATLDFDDLQSAKSFRAMRAYGRSKLCNILFTRQLARSLQGTGVTANCLHPEFVATRFADESGGLISRLAWLAKFFAISPAEGAQTIIYLASSPEVANVTGKYFYKCRPTTPSAPALDDRAALALWERSAALAGMKE